MANTPVKHPKLPITTAYFKRDGGMRYTYQADPVRAAMLAEGHLIMDHYEADLVQIYDTNTADLYWEKTMTPDGIATTFKCNMDTLEDPLRKKVRATAYLLEK